MTDKALPLLAALAPTAMSLIGIIFAKADLRDLKAEVRGKFSEIDGRSGEVRRLQDLLANKLDDVMATGHKDALEIMRQMTALHERVAVVEAKQAR